MTSENGFKPEHVREIALNFPEVKRLMIERAQIKQDAKNSPTHTKLTPHPKPKGDIHHSKIHKEKDNAKTARRRQFDDKLEESSKEIETAFHDNFEKADLKQMSQWAKEMDSEELVTFMEEGYDKVLENRGEKTKDQIQDITLEDLKMDEDKSKEIFGDLEIEQEIDSLEEKEIHHNQDIEQSIQMDEEESAKLFDRQTTIDDFKDNVKDLETDKKPSPADDFE